MWMRKSSHCVYLITWLSMHPPYFSVDDKEPDEHYIKCYEHRNKISMRRCDGVGNILRGGNRHTYKIVWYYSMFVYYLFVFGCFDGAFWIHIFKKMRKTVLWFSYSMFIIPPWIFETCHFKWFPCFIWKSSPITWSKMFRYCNEETIFRGNKFAYINHRYLDLDDRIPLAMEWVNFQFYEWQMHTSFFPWIST